MSSNESEPSYSLGCGIVRALRRATAAESPGGSCEDLRALKVPGSWARVPPHARFGTRHGWGGHVPLATSFGTLRAGAALPMGMDLGMNDRQLVLSASTGVLSDDRCALQSPPVYGYVLPTD